MNWSNSVRLLASALVALSLAGCFTATVKHTSVENGYLNQIPESYSESPNQMIIVPEIKDGVAPKVSVLLSADSDEELAGITFSIYRYSEVQDQNDGGGDGYDLVAYGYKYAASNQGGTLVWEKQVDMAEYDGKPIVLDLSGTSLAFPLRFKVVAYERDGHPNELNANYCYWPAKGVFFPHK